MNKLTCLILFFSVVCFVSNAQSRERIKGDRNVTIKQTYIDDFQTLIIKNNFEVNIAYNSRPSVEIEADNNLHDVIDVSVSNGILSISTNVRITTKKKLIITINYGESLNNIELLGNSELRSLTSMELGSLNLKTTESSRAYLNIKSKSLSYTASDKSKSRLNVVADSTNFILSDNSKIDALLTCKSSKFDIYQRADATIEGDSETAILRIDNSGSFYGKNFLIKDANLLMESSSDATIYVEKSLNLDASGTSETYVYGDAKISLEAFTGSAKLQKKNTNDKGLF